MRILNAKKLEKLITEHSLARIADGRLGGVEFIVNQNGRRIVHLRFGTFSTGGKALPDNCVWRLASMTKPITSTAVLKLCDEGRIDLYAPVYEYLPEFKSLTVGHYDEKTKTAIADRPARNTLLVYHLLSHGSGIASAPMCDAFDEAQAGVKTIAEAVNWIADKPIMYDPGMGCAYSPTLAFDVAARIVEKVSGISFAEYLKLNVFEPLGMKDTTFEPSMEQWERMPAMHARGENGVSRDDAHFDKVTFSGYIPGRCFAGAGLVSTAEDYSRFAQMLLNGGEGVLSEKAVKAMRTPHVAENYMAGNERWGLGVRVVTRPEYKHGLEIGSFGWSGAYGTHFWVDPVNNITAIQMKNCIYDGGAGNKSACEFEEDVSASLE